MLTLTQTRELWCHCILSVENLVILNQILTKSKKQRATQLKVARQKNHYWVLDKRHLKCCSAHNPPKNASLQVNSCCRYNELRLPRCPPCATSLVLTMQSCRIYSETSIWSAGPSAATRSDGSRRLVVLAVGLLRHRDKRHWEVVFSDIPSLIFFSQFVSTWGRDKLFFFLVPGLVFFVTGGCFFCHWALLGGV